MTSIVVNSLSVYSAGRSRPVSLLLLPRASMPAPVRIIKTFHLIKRKFRLILHNAELTDSVVNMNLRIAHRINRHKPLVIVPTVRTVDDSLMIGLDDAEILEGGASGHHMCLITLRQFHPHPQRNQFKLSFF